MIRVFPRRTKWTPISGLVFIGPPPLFRPPDQPVYVSVTFTWDISCGRYLKDAWSVYYSDVRVGGPAFDDSGGVFQPGVFIKRGVVITSRGCPGNCPWCFVPQREGVIRELPIKLGWIVQDNNLLACSRKHIEAVFNMLAYQGRRAVFSGGLDCSLFKDWHRELIEKIRVKELWFACDSPPALSGIKRAAKILNGIPVSKRRCYVMIGWDGETLCQAERRLESVFELGFLPFCQLYQGEKKKLYSREWRALCRKWSRPAAYRAKPKGKEEELNICPMP